MSGGREGASLHNCVTESEALGCATINGPVAELVTVCP